MPASQNNHLLAAGFRADFGLRKLATNDVAFRVRTGWRPRILAARVEDCGLDFHRHKGIRR
jgi:hypothetical protein